MSNQYFCCLDSWSATRGHVCVWHLPVGLCVGQSHRWTTGYASQGHRSAGCEPDVMHCTACRPSNVLATEWEAAAARQSASHRGLFMSRLSVTHRTAWHHLRAGSLAHGHSGQQVGLALSLSYCQTVLTLLPRLTGPHSLWIFLNLLRPKFFKLHITDIF